MNFDKSRVYTALNADELKVGSKVLVSNCVSDLKEQVANYKNGDTRELINICSESSLDGRFGTLCSFYHFAYLVEEPKENRLKWTDLKIGDVITKGKAIAMVTEIDTESAVGFHIYARYEWLIDEELKEWEKVEE